MDDTVPKMKEKEGGLGVVIRGGRRTGQNRSEVAAAGTLYNGAVAADV